MTVRELLGKFTNTQIENITLTQEARDLANVYISERVVGETSLADCQHIAIATIARVDVLVSCL